MATYLITGVTGFLGSYLAEALVAGGNRVIGMGRREQGCLSDAVLGHSSFTLMRGDCTEGFTGLRGKKIEGVFHCASRQPSSPDISYEDFHAGNVMTARAAALFSRETGARFMIYPSSTAVYGAATGGRILDESTPVSPDTWYGLTKYAGEQVTALTLSGSGTRAVIVRFPSLYGKRHRGGLVHTYYQLAAANADVEIFGGGKASRSIVHADDAVRMMFKAAENATDPCAVFTAGSSDVKTTMEIARSLVSLTGSGSRLITREEGRSGDIVVSTEKMQRALGFRPQDIAAGLRRYVEEMRHEI